MTILIWILQGLLAFLCLSGGAFKAFKTGELAKMPATSSIPPSGWRAIGVFEMAAALLLIVPAALSWMPTLTPLAAALVLLESLFLGAFYARSSRKLSGDNPLTYVVVMAILAGVVAYARFGSA